MHRPLALLAVAVTASLPLAAHAQTNATSRTGTAAQQPATANPSLGAGVGVGSGTAPGTITTAPATPTPGTSSIPTTAGVAVPPPTPGQAAVEQPANARMVSLPEVVRRARTDPPAVLAAIAQWRASEAQISAARAALLPTVSATLSGVASATNTNNLNSTSSGSTTCTGMDVACVIAGSSVPMCTTAAACMTAGGTVFTGGFGGSSGGLTTTAYLDATVNLRWTIWDFGRTALNVDSATYGARGAQQDLHAAQRSAIATAATAFYALLADEEQAASFEETLRQREQELEISRGFVQAGARAQIEQTRAEVAVDTARLDLTTAQAAVVNDAAALAAALAIDPVIAVRVSRPNEIVVDDDPAHAADAALAARPEIAAARLRLQSAEYGLRAARAGYRPSLTTSGSAGARLTAQHFPQSDVQTVTESATASLALVFPIFDPTINANIRIADAQLALARAQTESQILAVRTDAVQAALSVRTARQAYEQAERLAAGARANLEQAEGRYRAGAAQQLELIDAQAADATARLAVIRARFQLESAKVRLIAAIANYDQLEGRQ